MNAGTIQRRTFQYSCNAMFQLVHNIIRVAMAQFMSWFLKLICSSYRWNCDVGDLGVRLAHGEYAQSQLSSNAV